MLIPVTPVTKPRMTQRDKWVKRPCTQRYWAFKDEIKFYVDVIPQPCKIIFTLPMPKSWSKKKRGEHINKPHMNKPDLDNLVKALSDAVYDDDKALWNYWLIKVWGETGSIEIEDFEGGFNYR